jgi:hypothetical protein
MYSCPPVERIMGSVVDIQHFYLDGWGADERNLDLAMHTVGKR